MRTARVEAADGRLWEVRAFRVRMPPWRQVDIWGDSQSLCGGDDILSIVLGLIALPFTLVLIPLAIAIAELPVALVRGAVSKTIWVEAASHFPREERYLWRTTRVDVATVHASIAASLSAGEAPNPARAQLVERPALHV